MTGHPLLTTANTKSASTAKGLQRGKLIIKCRRLRGLGLVILGSNRWAEQEQRVTATRCFLVRSMVSTLVIFAAWRLRCFFL
jgi:hypothetical protein